MVYQLLLNEIQEVFFGMLERKTSWGRNEIRDLWKDAVIVVASRRLDATQATTLGVMTLKRLEGGE